MSKLRMESLPEEMLLEITGHLSGEDLASMCATNYTWRDIFNRDVFWKPRCEPELAQHLRSTECVVEPVFVSPEVEGSGLSDVCEFRLCFMRQIHLRNNWSLGRVKIYEVAPKIGFSRQPESCCVFYGNDLAITNGLPKPGAAHGGFSVVELWDVKGEPTLISEMDVLLANANVTNTSNQVFQVFGDFLVIWDVDLVHVLEITPRSRNLQFKHCFYYHEENKSAEKVKQYSSLCSNRDITTDSLAILMGPMFLGSYSIPTENKKMHIWNVETGSKLKVETYEDCTFVKIYGKTVTKNDETIVVVVQESESIFKTLIYNITQLAFKPFAVTTSECPYGCEILGQFIALQTSGDIDMYSLYCTETSKVVVSIPFPFYHALRTFEKKIVFYDKVGFHACNTLNEEMERLMLNETPIPLFQVNCNKFFMLYNDSCCLKYLNLLTKLLEVKINTGFVLSNNRLGIGLPEILCPNQLCTRFLLHLECDVKKVLNFW